MSEYTATVQWERGAQLFTDNRYSRRHIWTFDGGVQVPASASPHVVPLPYADAGAVDPEEAFVAALSSCHMLWFLSLAAQRGFCVDHYTDAAMGVMGKDQMGRLVMTCVTLRPRVAFVGDRLPTHADIQALHEQAHAECYLANSVKTEMRCEPVWPA
ncbi:MAG: OsmC family protein [Acidobacteria bacterium]|nr:OsmC family protein [Acidobacteriota bacterium]MBI3425745.1 OsmC family protein [Acidobacteriota bacterium]